MGIRGFAKKGIYKSKNGEIKILTKLNAKRWYPDWIFVKDLEEGDK